MQWERSAVGFDANGHAAEFFEVEKTTSGTLPPDENFERPTA